MNFLVYGFALVFLIPISLLPFSVLYFLSDLSCFFLFTIFRYRRGVVTQNIASAFPGRPSIELKALERTYYSHLCDVIFETIKCLTISKKEIARRCLIKDLEILDEYNGKGRSVVAVLGHYGNWEWAALSSALSVKQQMAVVYKPLSNTYFDRLINKTRARFGVEMVAMKDVYRFYFENAGKVFVNCFVADQSPPNRKNLRWVPFLNKLTPVTVGPEKIAVKFDHAVIFVSLQKVKRGFYHLRMKKLSEMPRSEPEGAITEMHTQALEDQINQEPAFWLWSHRRWRLKPGNRHKSTISQ